MRKNGDTFQKIAVSLNLSVRTIQRNMENILDCEESGLPLLSIVHRKGRKKEDLSGTMMNLCEIVSDDPLLNQKGMALKLERNNIKVSQSCISKNLKKLRITRKRIKKVYNKVTESNLINQRREFSIKYRNVTNERLIYLDETGLNLHSVQNYGYSPANSSLSIAVPVRKANVSSLVLISNNGIMNHKIVEGTFNSGLFVEFFEDCLRKGIVFEGKKIIMDNARIHKSETSLSYLSSKNISFDFLPPYSPQLNPIEEFFSSFKARYHAIRPIAQTNQELIRNVKQTLDVYSNSDCDFNGFYNHMKQYLDKAFNREVF